MGAISKSRKNGVREGDTRGEREGMIAGYFSEFFFSTLACPVLSCAHYFQAPATHANKTVMFRENGLCYKSVRM